MHNIINISLTFTATLIILVTLSGCKLTNKKEDHKQSVNNPSVNVQNSLFEHLRILSSNELSGRKIGSEGSLKAQDYIISVLKHEKVKPLDINFRHSFKKDNFFGVTRGNNIIGLIQGEKFIDRYIVLSAHYDHLGTHGRKVFNGSDDNASGTAALLSMANKLVKQPLAYSVLLLFTDGEESNLLGARAFIKDNTKLVSKVVLNINLDMIAGDSRTKTLRYIEHDLQKIIDDDDIKVINQLTENSTLKLRRGFRNVRDQLKQRINWKMASDHGVFYQEKIPFIYYGVGSHKNYHTPKDTYQNVNLPFYSAATNFIYQQLRLIDQVLN